MVACADDSLSRSGSSRRIDRVIDQEEDEDPTSSTVPTTADEQDNAASWPTAEGYTPLGDMFGSVLVAMPPGDDDDDGENNGETYFSAGPNAFVADPSALFGNAVADDNDNNDNDNDGMEEQGTGEGAADFRDAASSALMALEHDYRMTLRGEVRPSLMDAQPPTITGGPAMPLFDSTSLAPVAGSKHDDHTTSSSNFADFGSATASSNLQYQKETKEMPDIDAAAVQKAVAGIIHNTSGTLGAKLKQWQEEKDQATKERRKKREHEVIPPAPLKAFFKDTPKAIQATTTLTRAATIAESLHRISALLQSQECLHIHIVGADPVECQSEDRMRQLFSPLARWIGNNIYSPRHVKLSLVGPNVPSHMAALPHFTNLLHAPPEKDQAVHRLHSAEARCYEASYHDWLATKQQVGAQQQQAPLPDLVVCFNAGIWGYDEWKPTIRCLLNLKGTPAIPFLVTSYTIQEAEDDFDVIQQVVDSVDVIDSNDTPHNKKIQCIWEPEANRFASKQKRETVTAVEGREYRENAAWQAWRL